jgi:hypothetical protein
MRKPRLICRWHLEQDDSDVTVDAKQTEEERHDGQGAGNPTPGLVCVHRKDPKACPICSRDWTESQTGQLPYRPKAA